MPKTAKTMDAKEYLQLIAEIYESGVTQLSELAKRANKLDPEQWAEQAEAIMESIDQGVEALPTFSEAAKTTPARS